jgi:hypothetical protein
MTDKKIISEKSNISKILSKNTIFQNSETTALPSSSSSISISKMTWPFFFPSMFALITHKLFHITDIERDKMFY